MSHLTEALRDGTGAGVFCVNDPDYVANVLWTQVLETMHLALVGVSDQPA